MPDIAATPDYGAYTQNKGVIGGFLYWARNVRSRRMFTMMREHMHGHVLDVGGNDFFETAKTMRLPFSRWTTLEPDPGRLPRIDDPAFEAICADGCAMTEIASSSIDTVLCIQVVEHVFEPNRMMEEIGRVLKPGGKAIVVAPQTSALHMAPLHYYNFTRYWLVEACKHAKLEVVTLEAQGGRWSTTASHMLYFFLQSLNFPGMHAPEEKRPALFYVLWPLMAVTAMLALPWCLFLSLGDLAEEPNNHLLVARRR